MAQQLAGAVQFTNLLLHHDPDGVFNGSCASFLRFRQQLIGISAPQNCVPALPVLLLFEGKRESATASRTAHVPNASPRKRTSVTPIQSRSQPDCGVERKHRNTSVVAVMR